MNWDALGAIGELVGAVAVVSTLFYLAMQVRQNTKAQEAEFGRANLEGGLAWMSELIRDEELTGLYLRGLDQALDTKEDKVRFHLLLQGLFQQWFVMHTTNQGPAEADVEHVLSTPGGREHWRRAKRGGLHVLGRSAASDRFIEMVDAVEARVADDA